MKNIKIAILLTMLALPLASLHAYDIAVDNAHGLTIYYNLIDDDELEVTYDQRFRPTSTYSGVLVVPETVNYDGLTYRVTAIGDNAFFNCRQIETTVLPPTIKSIGMHAFAWCDAMTDITLPASVERIGANAFDGCYALTSITTEGGNAYYADQAGVLYSADRRRLVAYLPAAEGSYTIADDTKEIADGAFGACTFLTDVIMPDGLLSVGDNAFYFCNMLDAVNVPASVGYIGKAAFADCASLESINVNPANEQYTSVSGLLYDKDVTTLIQSPGGVAGNVEIPNSVTTIGENAFLRNYNLTTIKIPEGVQTIGTAAFIDCPALTSVEIPSTVNKIGPMAWALCDNLTSIYAGNPNPEDITLGDNAFLDVDTDICTLYVPAGTMQKYAEAPQWRDFKYISPYNSLKDQTIQWAEDVDTLLVGNTLALNAVSTSKLPVHYMLSAKSLGRAYIDDNLLMIISPGLVTVTAYQPGNIEYSPATPVSRTFTVKLSQLDDIAADNIKVYGSYGAIVIKDADADTLAYVYDVKGRNIYCGTERTIRVQPGAIYIVRLGTKVYKVAVM